MDKIGIIRSQYKTNYADLSRLNDKKRRPLSPSLNYIGIIWSDSTAGVYILQNSI